jgi:pyruvate dehydrogenase E2 component (dihydrolipoyllysine-residue acetyltransferase)
MDIKLPRLAEGVETGTVVNILISEGQEIKKDQPFMELETQKAVGSIPAPESGTVTKIHVKEGMEVAVGQILISIAPAGAPLSAGAPSVKPAQAIRSESSRDRPEPAFAAQLSRAEEPSSERIGDYRYESKTGVPPPAAPAIRKIARELGIDLTRISGSESGGRIVLDDLRLYIQRLQQIAFQDGGVSRPPFQASGPQATPPPETVDFSKWGPVRREKMTALRRTVSQRMAQSWAIPKINQFDDADITGVLALRKKYAGAYEKKQAHLTLTPFVLHVVAKALRKHPRANTSMDESTHEIIYKDYCHIGVAVDTEAGLIVPVLRDVDKKSLLDVTRELNELTDKTRRRKATIEDLQGGTFTISNQGSIGGSYFTPIIYAPQVAILGIGQGGPKPVVSDGKVVIRTLMPLCLSYDHRVLDGGDAVRFLKEIVAGLQSFPESEVKIK